MGWFQKILGKKTEENEDRHPSDRTSSGRGADGSTLPSEVYQQCPVCGRRSFFRCSTAIIPTQISASTMVPFETVVGDKTGVCKHCGAMCYGHVYLRGLNEADLIGYAVGNNSLLKRFLDWAARRNEELNDDDELIREMAKQLEEIQAANPDYLAGNFPDFHRICMENLMRR